MESKSQSTPPLPDDQQARRAAALAEITRAISTSLDIARSFTIVAQQAQHILPHDAMAILLPDTERDSGHFGPTDQAWRIAFCDPPEVAPDLTLPLAKCSFGPALLAAQPVVIEDFSAVSDQHVCDRIIFDSLGRAAVIAPIQAASDVLGGLVLISRTPRAYRLEDAYPVEPLAGMLALALEHQRLEQQSRTLAVVEERNRLARELHDTLAQTLTNIILNLESFKPFDVGRSQADVAVLAETEDLARDALAEARRSVLDLQPTPLRHQSLPDVLTSELAALEKRAGPVAQFYLRGAERSLASDVSNTLYRVAQEAFHNIEKHAGAQRVIVGLAFEADAVVLTVEDDGIGFVQADVAPDPTGGFGLISMQERAHSVGGQLDLISNPDHGTIVRVTVPYIRPSNTPVTLALEEIPSDPADVAHPIRVLIVDDHATVRQGIRGILDMRPDIQVVGDAADGQAALEQTGQLHPDVVLLDLQMPRLSGDEALPRLRLTYPDVEVVVLTMFDQDEQLFASLKAGARSYVLKDAESETIVEAVRAAAHGQSILPPELTTRMVDRFSELAQHRADPQSLTKRELEVLEEMAKGLPYKAIAVQLNISANTVQYHVTNIFRKLDAGNRSEAVAVAWKRGLLQ